MCSRLTLLCGFLIAALPAYGQAPITLPRITQPIQLDGLSNEPAWDVVAPWLPVQYEPNNGEPMTEHTEFLVAYDDTYLYLALRAFDSDPEGIRANTLYRDRLSGDDHFEILLDTFNDNETGVLFNTNPAGNRKDAAIFNDAAGGGIRTGGWINNSFNTYWDVATTINEDGWFAELRVPFTSLKFQEVNGKVTMGISLQRKVARKTERVVFPPVPSIANWAFLKPSLAQKIELEGIIPRKALYVTPYALGGAGRTNALNESATAYNGINNRMEDIGLDLKYGLTNNITADLTINTDFAQAEADDQQVNLTRFSLFFPEKRQFFQERAGIFDFRTGGLSRLFHSRRIGLTDDFQQVPLIGGARIVGRMDMWDVGILNIQSAEQGGLPSENFGVFRARRQVFNPYSYAGAMVTSRAGNDGSYNIAYGLDGVFQLKGNDFLTVQWAQTFDHEDQNVNNFANGRLTAEVERRTRDGWGYNSLVAWAGSLYNPGIGFTQRNDFTLLDNSLSYTWLPSEASSLIWHTFGVFGNTFIRNDDRTVESAEIGPEWTFSQRSGAGGGLFAKVHYEDLIQPFVLDDGIVIPEGDYTFFNIGAEYGVSHTSLMQLQPEIEFGTFYDGWRGAIQVRPVWYVSKHFELSGSYQYNRIEFPERDQQLNIHLARLRVGTALDTRLSVNTFVQYSSLGDIVSANIRFRYNFREGNDLWIVYNENLNADRHRILPTLPISGARTVLLKYTYTFQL